MDMAYIIPALGFIGVLIGGYAYLPQIRHLIKEKCSGGISIRAFALWSISSALILINAIYIASLVFIVLGVIQLLASVIILVLGSKNKNNICMTHMHGGSLDQL